MNNILKLKQINITIGKKVFKPKLSKVVGYPALFWCSTKRKIKFIFFYLPKIFTIPGFVIDYDYPVFAIKFNLLFSIASIIELKNKLFINYILLNIILQLLLVIFVYYLFL